MPSLFHAENGSTLSGCDIDIDIDTTDRLGISCFSLVFVVCFLRVVRFPIVRMPFFFFSVGGCVVSEPDAGACSSDELS